MQTPYRKQKESNPNETSFHSLNNTSLMSPVKLQNLSTTSVLIRKGSNRSMEKVKVESLEKDRGTVVAKLDFAVSRSAYNRRSLTDRKEYSQKGKSLS